MNPMRKNRKVGTIEYLYNYYIYKANKSDKF